MTYARYELVRTLRSGGHHVFTLALPLVLFAVVTAQNPGDDGRGRPIAFYVMVAMATWGGISAMIDAGARIVAERTGGWNRQLRITPLPAWVFLGAKVGCAYLMAVAVLATLGVAGAVAGVRLPAVDWAGLAALMLLGLLPFAALGVLLGHTMSLDRIGPVGSAVTVAFALVGGSWGAVVPDALARWVPSYWMVRLPEAVPGGWPPLAWAVIGVWTLATTPLAVRACRRDTGRH
ncbi:MAG: hypothetical protein S0880_36450 [Actinomycetota bacterium]|nr:hypothetical protein [Actinomycetota bacterium]